MSLCRAWRHDVCTDQGRCDCWCHASRMTAAPTGPEPRTDAAVGR